MAATHLLAQNPHPTMAEIREGLAGNLCRCTGFKRIFDSVLSAAAQNSTRPRTRRLMRGNAEAHELIAPGNLDAVLAFARVRPGQWTPIAGGTELMVAHAAGRLNATKLVSLWGIPDLRFIETTQESLILGACTTFRDLRADTVIAAEFPLLAKAVELDRRHRQPKPRDGRRKSREWVACRRFFSRASGLRRRDRTGLRSRQAPASLCEFHTGYKRTVLASDELVYAIHLPRRFAQHRQYLRKVGTRRAMAISKVALAGTALLKGDAIAEIRLAAASLAPFPARLYQDRIRICRAIPHRRLIEAARKVLSAEAQPIDDIRSTAEYRKRVGANLLEEFLRDLQKDGTAVMNAILDAWNRADEAEALRCDDRLLRRETTGLLPWWLAAV